jgi:hypothetical protein
MECTTDYESYKEQRVLPNRRYYSKKSTFNKRCFQVVVSIQIIGAAIITLSGSLDLIEDYRAWLIPLIGAIISVATGLSAALKYQEHWIRYRQNSELLKLNIHLYEMKAPPFQFESEQKNLQLFVTTVEEILLSENKKWSEAVSAEVKEK